MVIPLFKSVFKAPKRAWSRLPSPDTNLLHIYDSEVDGDGGIFHAPSLLHLVCNYCEVYSNYQQD